MIAADRKLNAQLAVKEILVKQRQKEEMEEKS